VTRLLEKAFEQASKLPEEDQDALAEMLLNDHLRNVGRKPLLSRGIS
jgi:hypothetical protein